MEIKREQIQWAAGLLEGEGCFETALARRKNSQSYQTRITCGQHERDRDVLERLQSILGGKIYGPYNRTGTPMLQWYLSRKNEVYAVGVIVYQFMGSRRKKAIEKQIETFVASKRPGRKKPYGNHSRRVAPAPSG